MRNLGTEICVNTVYYGIVRVFIAVISIGLFGSIAAAWILGLSKFSKSPVLGQAARVVPAAPTGGTPSPFPTREAMPTAARIPTRRPTRIPTPSVRIENDALWSALLNYRQEQGRTSLTQEAKLCDYAESRAKELVDRSKTLPSGTEPLDEHAGFKRDANSGDLFTRTGFHAVAENLAYIPEAGSATQVIEWGWDSSAAHRETQLSNDWTHACVVGISPFYVAIFAHQ